MQYSKLLSESIVTAHAPENAKLSPPARHPSSSSSSSESQQRQTTALLLLLLLLLLPKLSEEGSKKWHSPPINRSGIPRHSWAGRPAGWLNAQAAVTTTIDLSSTVFCSVVMGKSQVFLTIII
jgi:hypothetical protein